MLSKLAFVAAASLMMLLLLSAFSISAHAQGIAAVVPAELDKPFKLKVGQQAAIDSEKIAISLLNVTEDSRCPSDVVCIWQGQASVRVSAEVNGTDAGQFVLTIGGNEKSSQVFGGGRYLAKMASLEPYPVSTNQTMPEDYVATLTISKAPATASNSVFVRAAGGSAAAISGWNLQSGKGTLVVLSREPTTTKMAIARFTPTEAQCKSPGARECIDGHIIDARGIDGDLVHFELLPGGNTLYLAAGGSEYTLDVKQVKARPQQQGTTVTLSEGQRDGPLLVQEVGAGYVKGLNYVEYPLARQDGIPVTLHVGDTASNGCTVMLTLLETQPQQDRAVFAKTVDYGRPCPL
ncbi:MAG: hypothetical protein ABI348_05300 [Nitrososphaera sp.]